MSLALPVYVINLEEDVERMAGIAARLQALDIPFRRFPAYRGRNIPDQWQQEFRSNRFGDGEVGCYASHLGCMAAFLETGAPAAAILEDDARFGPDFTDCLSFVETLPLGWDMLYLSHPVLGAYVPIGTVGEGRVLAHYTKIGPTAVAYCVSRQGAEKMLARTGPRQVAVDRDMQDSWRRGLQGYVIVPLVAAHKLNAPSSIARVGIVKGNRPPGFVRAARRRVHFIRQAPFNIRKLSFRLWLRCERRNLYIWLRRRLGLPVPASLRRVDAFGALPRLPRDKAQAGGATRRP